MKPVQTPNAPSAIGPYSQAIVVNGLIYTSGQIALSPDGSEDLLKAPVGTQTLRVLENLKAVLEEAGSSLNDVIKTTIYLADMDSFTTVNKVYESEFGGHKPARSTIAVKTLPKNALVEIEAIALVTNYTF